MNQDIIEKQQVRGSSASIAKYAGKEGQIVFNRDNKRLHVMSGIAGQSTQYLSTAQAATKTQLSTKLDASTYNSEKTNFATKSQVTTGLASKVNTSTYTADKATFALKTQIPDISGLATKTQLTQGLAGKLNKTGKAASATVADSANAVAWANVSGKPTIPDADDFIPRSGNAGLIKVQQTVWKDFTVSDSSPSSMYTDSTTIMVISGSSGEAWTKVVKITSTSAVTVQCDAQWKWVGGSAPQIKSPGLLICHWHNDGGFINFLSGAE